MKCTWCGKPATQVVVYRGEVTWRRCREHALNMEAFNPGSQDMSRGHIPGTVLTDPVEELMYEVHES